MKNTHILFLLLVCTINSFSQIPTDGLVGYWPFNGNANDESGNGNNGILVGATLTSDRDNNSGSAYDFDGYNDEITLNAGILDGASAFSVSFWCNADTYTAYETVFMYSRGGGYNLWGIHANNGKFRCDIGNGNSYKVQYSNNETFVTGEWIHCVVTWQSGEGGMFYINGIEETSTNSIQTGTLSLTNDIQIGHDEYSSLGYFEGKIDDIIIYNRALNESEIQTLYSTEAPSIPQICNEVYCHEGNVGIGTADTRGYKLAVAGNIIAEEVKVALQTNWPDYVFDQDYSLEDLPSLESFIRTNKRLPEIPSAEDAESSGIELGEMNSKLLKKIEELTLYLISQDKEMKSMKERIIELEKIKQD